VEELIGRRKMHRRQPAPKLCSDKKILPHTPTKKIEKKIEKKMKEEEFC